MTRYNSSALVSTTSSIAPAAMPSVVSGVHNTTEIGKPHPNDFLGVLAYKAGEWLGAMGKFLSLPGAEAVPIAKGNSVDESKEAAELALDPLGIPLADNEFNALLNRKISFEGDFGRKEKKVAKRKLIEVFTEMREENDFSQLQLDIYLAFHPDAKIIIKSKPVTEQMDAIAFYDIRDGSITFPNILNLEQGIVKHEITHAYDNTVNRLLNKDKIQALRPHNLEDYTIEAAEFHAANSMPFAHSDKERKEYQKAADNCVAALKATEQCIETGQCSGDTSSFVTLIQQEHTAGKFPFYPQLKETRAEFSPYKVGDRFWYKDLLNLPPLEAQLLHKDDTRIVVSFEKPREGFLVSSRSQLHIYRTQHQEPRALSLLWEQVPYIRGISTDTVLEKICPELSHKSYNNIVAFAEKYKADRDQGFVQRLKPKEQAQHQEL